jgi:hypothetical protein
MRLTGGILLSRRLYPNIRHPIVRCIPFSWAYQRIRMLSPGLSCRPAAFRSGAALPGSNHYQTPIQPLPSSGTRRLHVTGFGYSRDLHFTIAKKASSPPNAFGTRLFFIGAASPDAKPTMMQRSPPIGINSYGRTSGIAVQKTVW